MQTQTSAEAYTEILQKGQKQEARRKRKEEKKLQDKKDKGSSAPPRIFKPTTLPPPKVQSTELAPDHLSTVSCDYSEISRICKISMGTEGPRVEGAAAGVKDGQTVEANGGAKPTSAADIGLAETIRIQIQNFQAKAESEAQALRKQSAELEAKIKQMNQRQEIITKENTAMKKEVEILRKENAAMKKEVETLKTACIGILARQKDFMETTIQNHNLQATLFTKETNWISNTYRGLTIGGKGPTAANGKPEPAIQAGTSTIQSVKQESGCPTSQPTAQLVPPAPQIVALNLTTSASPITTAAKVSPDVSVTMQKTQPQIVSKLGPIPKRRIAPAPAVVFPSPQSQLRVINLQTTKTEQQPTKPEQNSSQKKYKRIRRLSPSPTPAPR